MDGTRRTIDLNRPMNNNHDDRHYHHGNNPNDYDVPVEGIPVAGLDCNGHTFMSLLLQPSPQHSTPDVHLNLRHGQNNVDINSSGFEIGLHEHQVVSRGMDYMRGSLESYTYNLDHASRRNFTNMPNEIPYGNGNFIGPHYNEPVTMMEDLVEYTSSELAPVDSVNDGHPPNLHYSATSSISGFGQRESGPPVVEEIMFGGRIIQATRVELNPVRPSSFVSAPETTVSVPPVIPGPSAARYGQQPVFSYPQGVAATPNASGQPNFSGQADQGHLTAAQQHVRPASPIPSWAINNRDPQNYSDFMPWRIELDVAMESFEAGDPSEVDDVEEENSVGDSMYLELQDWSYEALIALQEFVGDVSTGLTEDEINRVLRREKFGQLSFDADALCCTICQEEYKQEHELGILKCSHQFHFDCIKTWLSRKNTCPLCRETA